MKQLNVELKSKLNDYAELLSDHHLEIIIKVIEDVLLPEEDKNPMTIDEYNKDLEDAQAEYKRGEVVSHEEVLRTIREKYFK